MIIIGFKGKTLKPGDTIVQAILSQQIGGVILFDYDFQTSTYEHNVENPTQLKSLTQQLQNYNTQAAFDNKNGALPLFISIDYEGGKVNRLREDYGFPLTFSAREIGCLSLNQAKIFAKRMAMTLKKAGINVNFSPVLDININVNNPIIGKLARSFSRNPQAVSAYANLFSKAYQDLGIIPVYKHFPGHGSTNGDTHAGFVDITSVWRPDELIPYQQLLLTSSSAMVMTAHVVNYKLDEQGLPASLSNTITHKLLRNKLNYNGVIITDDMQMKAITAHYGLAESVRLAINAEADILIFGNQLSAHVQTPEQIVELIYEEIMTGKIPHSRIEESYQRIQKLKKSMQQKFNRL